MKPLFRKTLFFTLLLVFLFCSAAYAMELEINVQKGEKYSYDLVDDSDFVSTINNKELAQKRLFDIALDMEIVDVDTDKNAVVKCRFNSLKIKNTVSRHPIDFDSTNQGLFSIFGDIFNGFIGTSFTATIDRKGNILELHGVDDVLDTLLVSLPGYEQSKDETRKIILQVLSNDILKKKLKLECYPGKNINVGSSWEKREETSPKSAVIIEKTKVLSEKDGFLQLELTATLDKLPSKQDNNGNFTKFSVSGNLNINKNNALLQSGQGELDMQWEIEKTDQQGNKIIIPVKLFSKLTCEIAKQ